MAEDGVKLGSGFVELEAKTTSAEKSVDEFEKKIESKLSAIQSKLDALGAGITQTAETTSAEVGGKADQTADAIDTAADKVSQTVEKTGANVVDTAHTTAAEVEAAASSSSKKIGRDVEAVGESAKKSGKEAATGFEKVSISLKKYAVSAAKVTAVATTFFYIGTKIGKMLFEQKTQTELLTKELNKLPAAYQNLTKSANQSQAEEIKMLAAADGALKQRIDAFEKGESDIGLSLEEALIRRQQIQDKYNQKASRGVQEYVEGVVKQYSGVELLELIGDDDEKEIVARLNRIVRAAAEAKEKIAADQAKIEQEAAKAVQDDIQQQALDSIAAQQQAAKEERKRTLQLFREQNRELEDQIVGPVVAEERRLAEQLAELNERLRATQDGELKDAINRQIQLLEEQKSNKELDKKLARELDVLPETIQKSVADGMVEALEATGLLSVTQTLSAINKNQRLIASELRRNQSA